jgi:hypothetical protein
MHPFFRRLLLTFLTTALAFAAGLGAFLVATQEEGVFLSRNIETDSPVLWGPGFDQQIATYKLRRVQHVRPDLLVLGSSRVTQLRGALAPNIRFYNAGLGASSLPEALAFLKAVYRHNPPKIVALGIDPWWFNPSQGRASPVTPASFNHRRWLASAVTRGMLSPTVMRHLLSGLDVDADRLAGRRPVGYLAAAKSSGFRPDGSYQYGDVYLGLNPLLDVLAMTFEKDFAFYTGAARQVDDRFRYIGDIAERQIEILQAILKANRAAGVETVLFLPSFPAAVWRAIQTTPVQRDYFARFTAAIARTAAAHDVEMFDYQDLAALGVSDKQTVDGLHSDEIANARLWLDMVMRSKVLSGFYGPSRRVTLKSLLEADRQTPSPHILVP